MNRLYKLIATVFYTGYIPFIPGTISSILAFLLYLLIRDIPFAMAIAIFLSVTLGFLSAGKAEALFKKKDPRSIVIDEFAGMLVALFLLPQKTIYAVAAFFLFRFFDVAKTWPIAGLERLRGSRGIMFDDIVAGIYANLLLQAINLIV